MRWRWTTWLALGLWLVMLTLIAGTLVMKALDWHGNNDTSNSGLVALYVAFLGFATMGSLVAARVPRNPLGWIFLAIALLFSCAGAAESYAFQGLVDAPGSLPAALFVGWINAWAWEPAVGLIGLVPLLYPTGKVPGRRWRSVQWAFIGLLALSTLRYMLHPGPLGGSNPGGRDLPDNPVGIGFVGAPLDGLVSVLGVALVPVFLAIAVSVFVRFHRSRGDERQQLKWMGFAIAFVLLTIGIQSLIGINNGADVLFSIAILQFPIAVGIAMLKYRLYDVDRVINKTLVYGVLTAILAGAYFGLVLAGQALFSSFAGGSNLAIAVSTLVVAALFLPARSRIQRLVDRRFYRRRYDAQRTLEGFGARLREQVELGTLTTELSGVVAETMQPAHLSLWLRREAAE